MTKPYTPPASLVAVVHHQQPLTPPLSSKDDITSSPPSPSSPIPTSVSTSAPAVTATTKTKCTQVDKIIFFLRHRERRGETKEAPTGASSNPDVDAAALGTIVPVVKTWAVFSLDATEFQELLAEIVKDRPLSYAWKNNIRYDFFSKLSRFAVRMVTVKHESVRSSIRAHIEHQLGKLGEGTGEAAEYARQIKPEGSPRLHFPASQSEATQTETQPGDRHDPDETFIHPDGKYPVAILEVAYSQKGKMLKYLADDYILGSDGNTRLLIGIKMDYEKPQSTTARAGTRTRTRESTKRATFSVWRPQLLEEDDGTRTLEAVASVEDCVFRDDAGNFVDGPGIQLQLQDFATEALFGKETDSLTQSISISSSSLFEYLRVAESRTNNVQDNGSGKQIKLQPGTRKRWRQRTPEEEVGDEEDEEEAVSSLGDAERPAKKRTSTWSEEEYKQDAE